MKGDFLKGSVCEGFKIGEFHFVKLKLSKTEHKKLLKLLAHVMEDSYRRGVQQALIFDKQDSFVGDTKDKIRKGLFRRRSIDKTPDHNDGRDSLIYKTSVSRFMGKYHDIIAALGFGYPEGEQK